VLRKNFQDEGRVRSPQEKGSQKEVENLSIAQLFFFFYFLFLLLFFHI